MKIDWKKELKFPSLRGRGKPTAAKASADKPSTGRRSLKGPEPAIPKVVSDLYADLRDRRLLPVVALLIAAIIAAPILLNKGSHEEEPALTPAVAAGAEASDVGFSVVPAEPGLRDYKKRLRHRTALNPFRRPAPKQQAQSKSGASSGGPSETESTTTTGTAHGSPEQTATIRIGGVTREVPASSVETIGPEETTKPESTKTESTKTESTKTETGSPESTPPASTPPATSTSEGTSSPEGTPSESTGTKSRPTETKPAETTESSKPQSPTASSAIVGYTIDAEAGFVPRTTEKTELAPMTKLPSAKHPLVLYMGLSKNHKRALFLMTSNVTAYYGGHCALDKASCQLVEVQAGKGITFADGYGESRYKVHLKRIVPVRHFSK